MPYSNEIGRKVMEDHQRPCLFGVRGPCSHPKCLDAHYKTLWDAAAAREQPPVVYNIAAELAAGFSVFPTAQEGTMKDQHEKITGYRDLSQGEIDLMNEGKALASQVGEYVEKLLTHPDTDKRWVAVGKTQAQQAFMALIRGVAQPTTF